MPMAELADAIVQCGRSTLEWSKEVIETQWPGAKVVYGDTDSLFVHLPGRTKDQALVMGQQMADYITAKCPGDVELKFEKVYYPSILVSKKRYRKHFDSFRYLVI
jgi:DNA polymerase zeta